MKNIIKRTLSLDEILKRKSIFLFGARQTGKSTFIKANYPKAHYYSLLESDLFLRFSRDPSLLRREISALSQIKKNSSIVIIDEIQKMPDLLNEVHWLIEEKKIRFILTGSSARKLYRGGVNLLGGRATQVNMHPFTSFELGKIFDLNRAMQFGMLPSLWFSPAPWEELKDYVDLYLREEVMAEGLVRRLPTFSRFLEVAALSNGQMINFTKTANDAQMAKTTCFEYFQILKDTLIAFELPSFNRTRKRKGIETGKFYFFDSGVVRYLQGRNDLKTQDADWGSVFECFIFHELKAYSDYKRLDDLNYWRSTSGFEVDFVLNKSIAIEVKSTKKVNSADLKGLRALKEEKVLKKYLLVSNDKTRQEWDGILCLYYQDFLEELWADQF